MKQVIEQLIALQSKLEKIEARLLSLDIVDSTSLKEAELLLTQYQNKVLTMENFILHKRLEIERKDGQHEKTT